MPANNIHNDIYTKYIMCIYTQYDIYVNRKSKEYSIISYTKYVCYYY